MPKTEQKTDQERIAILEKRVRALEKKIKLWSGPMTDIDRWANEFFHPMLTRMEQIEGGLRLLALADQPGGPMGEQVELLDALAILRDLEGGQKAEDVLGELGLPRLDLGARKEGE